MPMLSPVSAGMPMPSCARATSASSARSHWRRRATLRAGRATRTAISSDRSGTGRTSTRASRVARAASSAHRAQSAQVARCASSTCTDMPSGSSSRRADTASRTRSHLTQVLVGDGRALVPGVRRFLCGRRSWAARTGIDAVTAAALRARRGDTAAATAFVRATQADVWRLCAHLGSPDRAEDLTQDTYARAFASLHRFAGRSAARTWLLSIARNVCADAVRSAQRDRRIAVAAVPADADAAPDLANSVAIRALVAGLDVERREAFVLTQVIGLSYAEAADVCSCPVGTIRSRVARARADLVDGLRAGDERQSRTDTG